MATTVMEIADIDTSRSTRQPYFSAIRWGAILGGVVAGTATYLLLSLLGLAVGLTAVDPNAAEPVGSVPLATGIWTGVSMLVGAFIGGYVAGHMSGLARSSDGMMHGFVSWAATTLLYSALTLSALGAILGGTFSILGQTIQTTAQAAGQVNQAEGQGAIDRFMSSITGGSGQVQASPETLQRLREAHAAGNRDQALNIMTQEMGIERQRAEQIMNTVGPMIPQNPRQAAATATDTLAATSWWLFVGLLLSLALGIMGGAAGTRATGNRTDGDHLAERKIAHP